MWHPSAHWETSRIAAIGPRAARYGRSRPLLTLAPFTALRTRARVKKEYLPTHPWASGKTPARALRKWRATGVNQFADMLTQCGGPLGKDSPPGSLRSHGGLGKSEEKAPVPTRSSGTLGEAYAQKALQRCGFLSSVSRRLDASLCGLLQTRCCAALRYSPRSTTERAFNSTVLLSSPHALQQQRAASEVKLEQIAQSKEWAPAPVST